MEMDSEPICPLDSWSPCFHHLSKNDLDAIARSTVPIPYNEAERLFVVRETQLIDSDPSDPMFDRFVYLAQRLFNVPVAIVGLMDVDRQYNKAGVGIHGEREMPRNFTFCAYTILPNVSDVLVVEDATKDVRFKDNLLVTGAAHLRFYAGAALTIDNVKVGTICIFDIVPRHDFSEKDKMNILDLAEAVSTLIRERKGAALSSDKICAAMVTDMMHNVRTPLAAIDMATSMMLEGPKVEKAKFAEKIARFIVEKMREEKDDMRFTESTDVVKMTRYCKAAFEAISDNNKSQNNSCVVRGLQAAVGQLKVVVESSICLGQLIVEKAEKNYLGASFTLCNIMNIIYTTQQTLVHMEYSSNIRWKIDSNKFSSRKEHICSPKAINFLLLNTVEQLISQWKNIVIDISFLHSDNNHEYESIHKILEGTVRSPGGSWHHGILCINILLFNKIIDPIENSFMPKNHLSFYSRDQVLKDCEGTTIENRNDVSKTENIKFLLPCASFECDGNVTPLLSRHLIPINSENNINNNDGYDDSYKMHSSDIPLQPISYSETCDDKDNNDKSFSAYRHSSTYNDDMPLKKFDKYKKIDITDTEKVTISRRSSVTPISPTSIPKSPTSLLNSTLHLSDFQLSPLQLRKGILPSDNKNIVGNKNDIKNNENSNYDINNGDDNSNYNDNDDDDNNCNKKILSISTSKLSNSLKLNLTDSVVNPTPLYEKKLRVLLVEDSLSIQKLMTRWLKSRGCDVTIASNGKIGLNYMLTQEYDVCFMDFLMPVMSGPEAISSFYNWSNEVVGGVIDAEFLGVIEAYNRSINKEMLLVGMSANAGDTDIDVAFQHGMHFYCPKPAETTMLTAILAVRNANSFEDTLSMISLHARGGSDKYSTPGINKKSGFEASEEDKSNDKWNDKYVAKEKYVEKDNYKEKSKTPHQSQSFPTVLGGKDLESTYSMDGWKLFKRITESSSRSKIPPIDLSSRSTAEFIET